MPFSIVTCTGPKMKPTSEVVSGTVPSHRKPSEPAKISTEAADSGATMKPRNTSERSR